MKLHPSANIGINSIFEGMNAIDPKASFTGYIGRGSYIGNHSNIYGRIGRYCSIAPHVNTLTGTHPIKKFVSTHPAFFSSKHKCGTSFVNETIFDELIFADEEKQYPVIIGNDVWIGFGVTIVSGIIINDGAIVLSGSVVTKEVPPYSIVGGVPAKEIGSRFSQNQVKFLNEFQWWNKSHDWLQKNAFFFSDIESFIQKFKEISV